MNPMNVQLAVQEAIGDQLAWFDQTDYVRRYHLRDGVELCVERRGSRHVNVWLPDDGKTIWPLGLGKSYPPDKSRNSNLPGRLKVGEAVFCAKVRTTAHLEQVQQLVRFELLRGPERFGSVVRRTNLHAALGQMGARGQVILGCGQRGVLSVEGKPLTANTTRGSGLVALKMDDLQTVIKARHKYICLDFFGTSWRAFSFDLRDGQLIAWSKIAHFSFA